MAWLKSGTCVAFLLGAGMLCGLASAEAPATKPATDECLLPTNLARGGRLNDGLSPVVKDATLEAAASNAISQNSLGGNDTSTCQVSQNFTPVNASVQGMAMQLPFNQQGSCASLIQGVLATGLSELATFPRSGWNNGAAPPYNEATVQNLMYLMYPPAASLGCAKTEGCTAGNVVYLCRFSPSLAADFTSPPMTEELFNALKARQAKGLDITTMTPGDLGTDLEGKPRGNAAFLALPGAIPAAALTITSLFGFAATSS